MRLAIYGGTFDPIHCAHLTVAREAAERFALDRVLFVPAAKPPHKSGAAAASYEHRLRMAELACAGEPRFEASRLESGPETSYTILTLERLRATLEASDKMYFLIGADAFAEIETWFRWRDVIDLADFIVVSRPGHPCANPAGARIERLETLALDVASSDLRRRLAAGESPRELPPAVLEFIRQNGLYRAA